MVVMIIVVIRIIVGVVRLMNLEEQMVGVVVAMGVIVIMIGVGKIVEVMIEKGIEVEVLVKAGVEVRAEIMIGTGVQEEGAADILVVEVGVHLIHRVLALGPIQMNHLLGLLRDLDHTQDLGVEVIQGTVEMRKRMEILLLEKRKGGK